MSALIDYSDKSLDEFLLDQLTPYDDILDGLEAFCTQGTELYAAFHSILIRQHTGCIQVKQFGNVYQVTRISSDRKSTGYLRYSVELVDKVSTESAFAIFTFRTFTYMWDDWRLGSVPSK